VTATCIVYTEALVQIPTEQTFAPISLLFQLSLYYSLLTYDEYIGCRRIDENGKKED